MSDQLGKLTPNVLASAITSSVERWCKAHRVPHDQRLKIVAEMLRRRELKSEPAGDGLAMFCIGNNEIEEAYKAVKS